MYASISVRLKQLSLGSSETKDVKKNIPIQQLAPKDKVVEGGHQNVELSGVSIKPKDNFSLVGTQLGCDPRLENAGVTLQSVLRAYSLVDEPPAKPPTNESKVDVTKLLFRRY